MIICILFFLIFLTLSFLLLYECDNSYSIWTKRCIRQADAILIICDASKAPEPGELEKMLDNSSFRSRAIKILCLLHKPHVVTPKNTVEYLNSRKWLSSHLHIKVPIEVFRLSKYCGTVSFDDNVDLQPSSSSQVDLSSGMMGYNQCWLSLPETPDQSRF